MVCWAWVRSPRRYIGALTGDIKKTYPQLGDVTADYAWAGTLGLTLHRMPQIGELGPGVWLASGFGGHGLNTTAMAGNIIARAIVEGDQTWRQFTPFELVWAGGAFGRVAARMRIWTKRLRDRLDERRAKARELLHRQVREAELAKSAQLVAAVPAAVDLVAREEPVTAADSIIPPAIVSPTDAIDDAAGRAELKTDGGAGDQRPKRKRRRPVVKESIDQIGNHGTKP